MLQQALQFPLPAATPAMPDRGAVLPLRQRAPAPVDHDDVREAVQAALADTSAACPIQLMPLLTANIATLLPPRLPGGLRAPRMLWRVLERLCAGGLSGLELRSPTDPLEPGRLSLIAWHSAEEFYHLTLSRSDVVTELLVLANEILESRDGLGRLYVLQHPSLSAEDGRLLVGCFTEGEALALESVGVELALV